MSHSDKQVLILDFDPQCNAGGLATTYKTEQGEVGSGAAGGGLYELLMCNLTKTAIPQVRQLIADATHNTRLPNVQVMYASFDQMEGLEASITANRDAYTLKLNTLLKIFKEQYDVVIVDTQGNLNNKALQCLLPQADAIISPVNEKDVSEVTQLRNTVMRAVEAKMVPGLPPPKFGFVLSKVPGQTSDASIVKRAAEIQSGMLEAIADAGSQTSDVIYLGKLRHSMHLPTSTAPSTPSIVLTNSNETKTLRDEFEALAVEVEQIMQ